MLFDFLRKACDMAFLDGENITLVLEDRAYVVVLDPLVDTLRCFPVGSPARVIDLNEEAFDLSGLGQSLPSSISARYFQKEMLNAE